MLPYHGLLFARLGAGLSEGSIHELDEELLDCQLYSADLEQKIKSLSEKYHELASNAGKLVEYTESVERERNRLREENDRLRQVIMRLRSR